MTEMRTAKIVVGVMTLILGIMMVLVFYGVHRNSKRMDATATELISNAAIWNKSLPLGASMVSMSAAGPSLAVLADTPKGRVVYLIDPKTGEIRGTLTSAP